MWEEAIQKKPEVRYEMRLDKGSLEDWTVFDVFTGEPVVVNGTVMSDMDMDEAEILVDLLNAEYSNRKGGTTH